MKIKMVVEIPAGSHYKYEVDKTSGKLKLDRVLNQVVPEVYGFSPETLFDDGDPIDVFLLNTYSIPPLTEVEVELYSILHCLDNNVPDDKLIAILKGDLVNNIYIDLRINKIIRYLSSYKEGFSVIGQGSHEDAVDAYEKSVAAYKTNKEEAEKAWADMVVEMVSRKPNL